MAENLLSAVNAVLGRVGEINQTSGSLTTFTDDARQHNIDVCKQLWKEMVEHVLSFGDFAQELAEGSITLVTDTREYALETDFKTFVANKSGHTVFVDQTNGRHLLPYSGGYVQMFTDQSLPANFTGLPLYWTLNEVTNMIRVERAPTSEENGLVYKYNYNKEITLSATTDTFPWPDGAVTTMIPGVAEMYRREFRDSFDEKKFNRSVANSLKIIRRYGRDRA